MSTLLLFHTAGAGHSLFEILGAEDLCKRSDFFALGGDSLLATRVLSAVAREYGVELSFDDFALAPTPAALAKLIGNGS